MRAIANLIDNALKYGGLVKVAIRPPSLEEIVIEVQDNGPGIPEAEKDWSLSHFTAAMLRVTHSGSASFGLGLSIAQAIVHAHGGP